MAPPFVVGHVEVALEVSHAVSDSGGLSPHPDEGAGLIRVSDETAAPSP
jgi:hypothetical protein